MNADYSPPLPSELAAVATEWARRCATGLSTDEHRDFQRWLRADPRHAKALAQANASGADCDWAWSADASEEILRGLAVKARRRRRSRLLSSTATAAALTLAALLYWPRPAESQPVATAATPSALVILWPERQTLQDGSIIELKPGAKLLTDYSGPMRLVTLEQGTAHFQVAKDTHRPFVVRVGGLAVRATGTSFSVGLETSEVGVLVTEGSVRVDPVAVGSVSVVSAAPLAVLATGDAVVLPVSAPTLVPAEVRTLPAAEMQEQTGWRVPKLEFTRTPLREVVEQMNRHNARKFELADPSVGEVLVSGILRADKADTLAETLEADFDMTATRTDRAIVLRRAR